MRQFLATLPIIFITAIVPDTVIGETQVSLIVGNWLSSEVDHPSSQPSPLTSPFGIDFDNLGNMYIVELEGGRIHRRDPNGQMTRIAGNGEKGYSGDGELAGKAVFNGMHNVAISRTGQAFIADTWNHAIRKIDLKSGYINTFAGNGMPGYSGDSGPAKLARFNYLMCATLDPGENILYLADLRNRRIRAIEIKTGIVHTVAGNGNTGIPQDGALAVDSPLADPRAVAADSNGNVYILERSGHALRRVSPNGVIQTVAGTGKKGNRDGPALNAQLNAPKHLCIDKNDCVYIADEANGLIRKYDPRAKMLVTVLGRSQGSPPVKLSMPHGVCIHKEKLYVVDTGHDRILRLE